MKTDIQSPNLGVREGSFHQVKECSGAEIMVMLMNFTLTFMILFYI